MKKLQFIVYLMIPVLLIHLFVYPYRNTVTIEKDAIVANYPFAGDMSFKDNPDERVFVSIDISCDYMLERDEQPDVVTIKTTRYGWLGLLLGLGSAEIIK